jgi:hypothetical protein
MKTASLMAAEKALRENREGRLRWVEPDLGYPGRVVNLRIGSEGYHFVATAEGARLERGEYPAPDGSLLLGDSKVWERLASGALSVGEAVRSGKARVWGNLNDVQAFLNIVSGR